MPSKSAIKFNFTALVSVPPTRQGKIFTATPTSVAGNDVRSVPGRPQQSRTVGTVTVYADSLAAVQSSWTASGTVWIGGLHDY